MKTLDGRGLDCPAPVLLAKKTVETERPDEITVLVDNEAAMENVSRFLASRDYSVSSRKKGDHFQVTAFRGEGGPDFLTEKDPAPFADAVSRGRRKIMVMVATDRMGSGDDELGRKLMISFLKTMKEMGEELWRLVLVNNGVRFAVEGSPVLEDLLAFEKEGLTILVCGTCLSHFDLLKAKKVGQTTNMLDIVTAMQLADKVIRV